MASPAGLNDGCKVYLRVDRETSGVELYRDPQGLDPIKRPATIPTGINPYLRFTTTMAVGASGIRGIEAGQELRVLALGSDVYQIATNEQEYQAAVPRFLLGNQLNNEKAALEGVTSPDAAQTGGISMATAIKAKNSATASASSGSNPKLRDYMNNPMLILAGRGGGNQGTGTDKNRMGWGSIVGSRFKDDLKKSNGGDFKTSNMGISLSAATNIVEHNAITTINGNITTTSAALNAAPSLNISNKITQAYSAYSDAATNKDSGAKDAQTKVVGKANAYTIANSLSDIKNNAQTFITSAANIGSREKPLDEITISNAVVYPNKFLSTFGSAELIKEYASNPANTVGALSGFSGMLIKNGFNSYSTVKNKSKDLKNETEKDKDGKDKEVEEGCDFAIAVAVNSVHLSAITQTQIAGRIYARGLDITNTNSVDSVLGAGDLHIDIGFDSAMKSFIGKDGEDSEDKKNQEKGQRSKTLKNFMQWGNVAKNGYGGVLNIERTSNKAETLVLSGANISLSGTFKNTSKQTGQVVHVLTASGSSNNFGLQGGVDLTLAGKDANADITGLDVKLGSSLAASKLISSSSNEVNRININGAVQYSESLGVGAVLIYSEVERRTKNKLEGIGGQLTFTDSIQLDAFNGGAITLFSIAGTATVEDSNTKTTNTSTRYNLRGIKNDNLQLAGAGSVGISILNDSTENEIKSTQGQLVGPKSITMTAKDTAEINNWSGAIAYSKSGSILENNPQNKKDQDANSPKQRNGELTLAGAAAVNLVNRDTTNTINGVQATGNSPATIHLVSDTRKAKETAGAISLSGSTGSGKNWVGAASIALNLDLDSSGSSTTSYVNNVTTSNFGGSLSIEAIEGVDATAIAGQVAIAYNPLVVDAPKPTSTSVAGTFGASIAINDLKVDTAARLSNSSITSTMPTNITLAARSEGVDMIASAVSGAGSIDTSNNSSSYAIAGSGAGAQNSYKNAITAEILQSTINSTTSTTAPSINIAASSSEKLLAMAGGIDVAIATASKQGDNATSLSVGSSAAINELSGEITARIDGTSTIQANQLTISAKDGSAVGAYAIAGALAASASPLGEAFDGAFVGSGTGNTVNRPVTAVIGDPQAGLLVGTGTIRANDLTLNAERTADAKLISDAAGAAISLAYGSKAAKSASFAGGFAFNKLSGGITSGVYNISDLSIRYSTSIRAWAHKSGREGSAQGNVYSFAGGFAVGGAQGLSGAANAGALGVAIAKNTINDSIKAQIKSVAGHSQTNLWGVLRAKSA